MMQFEPGQVYDVAHLRPFDMELAKAGHPLAMRDGRAVRLFRQSSVDCYALDYWSPEFREWWVRSNYDTDLEQCVRLAPLAVKDGKPLHVGDEIERFYTDYDPANNAWVREKARVFDRAFFTGVITSQDWRWPKD